MKNHKWKRLQLSTEAYVCVKCKCEKYAIATKWGSWEYKMPNDTKTENESFYRLIRPDCNYKEVDVIPSGTLNSLGGALRFI